MERRTPAAVPVAYFGGKTRAAALISARIGEVKAYIEPFAGSLAVLLYRRPSDLELVNDVDCYVVNFWRAVGADGEAVARWADWPMTEADLRARHRWLVNQPEFRDRIQADPDFFDAKIAGWWVWGICLFMGSGWCSAESGGKVRQNPPYMASVGGRGALSKTGPSVRQHIGMVSERLRKVKVACGDWRRVLGESSLFPTPKSGGGRHEHHFAGVVLDPPYKGFEGTYTTDGSPAAAAEEWARAHGEDPQIRIALCGYEGDYDLPGWTVAAWKDRGGYGTRDDAVENAARERVWFSPACLSGDDAEQLELW